MTKITITYFILALLFLSSGNGFTEAQMLKIKDGTALVGEIVAEPFVIQTQYGTLTVPLNDILQIIEEEVWLKNESHFFGKIHPQSIMVKTDYGDLEISTKQVVWMNFVKKEEPKRNDQ